MTDAPYELLGPAEKHVAKQLHDTFVQLKKALSEASEKVDTLADVDFETTMLDPEKRQTAVAFTDVLTKMPARVNDLLLALLMAEVVFARDEAAQS